ncbi:MAG TPA: hypothetical protein PLO05_01185 [Bacteroidales bacterium]|jgi:hypothetical protein|nr:hypothetical protein [Bacteroidales bacterium]HXK80753.1 hypothetical protein [Bacteroidales bacterium]
MRHILYNTPNGQIFRLKKTGDFIVEFKNVSWRFKKIQLIRFKNYIFGINAEYLEDINKNSILKRKIVIPVSITNISILLNLNEWKELKDLLGGFNMLMFDPNDIYDSIYLENTLKTDKLENSFDYKLIKPEITAFGKS